MNKKNQLGSGHLIIILALFLMLIGALGFVYWQNFMQPNTEVDIVVPIENNSDLTEIAFNQILGTDLAIKYPSNWVISRDFNVGDSESVTNRPYDKNIITSPDGATKVVLDVSQPTGFGVPCTSTVSTYSKLDSGFIAGYPTYGFVTYIEKFSGEETDMNSSSEPPVYYIGIHDLTSTSSKCVTFAGDNILKINGAIVRLEITNNTLSAIDNSVEQFMTTDNYKIAKRIVQSLYVKE